MHLTAADGTTACFITSLPPFIWCWKSQLHNLNVQYNFLFAGLLVFTLCVCVCLHCVCVCVSALAATSEAYFSSLAKIGEQALHTLSSRPIGMFPRHCMCVCVCRGPGLA